MHENIRDKIKKKKPEYCIGLKKKLGYEIGTAETSVCSEKWWFYSQSSDQQWWNNASKVMEWNVF